MKLREAIEAYDMTEAEEAREDDEDDDETVTFDDAMTGAMRWGGCGLKARAYTAMDIVRAIPVMKCEERRSRGWSSSNVSEVGGMSLPDEDIDR